MGRIVAIIFVAIFIDNFVLSRFFGICPFLGVSKKIETSIGMGMAVIFVMAMASLFTWLIYTYILVPLNLHYLQTIVFILVIAALVQFVEMFVKKSSPTLYQALGIFLPLITTNCAVLAVTLLNVQLEYNLLESVIYGAASAVGFTLALLIMAGIRERLQLYTLPKAFQGTAIALVTAGILSMAFIGFRGMIIL